MTTIILVTVFAIMFFATIVGAMNCYKKCPPDQVLVIYGKSRSNQSSRCIHGGAAFVWPLIQGHKFLDLSPIVIDIQLRNTMSKQNIRVNVPSRFTIGISTEPEIVTAAAERLLSTDVAGIKENAEDIILGQLRAIVATMQIEELNSNREVFEEKVYSNIETELKKVGLKLINVNITDITDESGYLEALGKKAAAEAINTAKVDVAKQIKEGAKGEAEAFKEQRVSIAESDARAVEGENTSKIAIAKSDSGLKIEQSRAKKEADSAERVNAASAEEAAYVAEEKAEAVRKKMELARQEVQDIVPAEIAKRKKILEAEANAEEQRQLGLGAGAKIKAELLGEAEGLQEILAKKAEGFKKIVDAAGGNVEKAALLLIVEQMPEIAKIQAAAISNIKFDKVVVMDGGSGSDGGNTTANWLSGITKSLPGLHEIASMAGIKLPGMLGEILDTDKSPNERACSEGDTSKLTEVSAVDSENKKEEVIE